MTPTRSSLRWSLIVLYVLLLLIPGCVFFSSRGGLLLLQGLTLASTTSVFFPLIGLYAFTLVALQLLVGSNLRRLRPLFPALMRFHRYQGLVAISLVFIHPSMVLATYGLHNFLARKVTSPSLSVYIILAELALAIIPVTVATAVLAWKFGRFTRTWRLIHLANYAAFALLWLHSWFVGSDVQASLLRYVWLFYGFAALASLADRLRRSRIANR